MVLHIKRFAAGGKAIVRIMLNGLMRAARKGNRVVAAGISTRYKASMYQNVHGFEAGFNKPNTVVPQEL